MTRAQLLGLSIMCIGLGFAISYASTTETGRPDGRVVLAIILTLYGAAIMAAPAKRS